MSLVVEDTLSSSFRYSFTNGVTTEQTQDYIENVLGEDELTSFYENQKVGNSWLSQDIWNLSTLEDFSAYQKFYHKIGWTYFTAGLFYQSDAARGYISVTRSKYDALFTQQQRKDLQLFLPHLHRSLLINLTLLERESTIFAYQEGLDHLSAGVVMFSANGNILFANKASMNYLARSQLLNAEFPLQLPTPKDSKRLHSEVMRILNSSAYCPSAYIRFVDKGASYTAVCVPWNRHFTEHTWLGSDSRCMVFFLTQDCIPFTEHYLKSAFDLSHAEANLVNVLCKGLSPKEASQQLFVSEATVRFHIRNILYKTESHSLNGALTKILQTLTIRLV